ncbi:hypothetical protein FisN_19Lh263 [Fistulifera solaris]|uniref:Uncharacterized protein n=1 Tax=Fistulifera solaris TaxID=1519565 RepID=A0A1Z5K7J2_FISSO|nr:hypothetical protein FisN_19Lh263 [Fistulifera solaris]|eukprot:GAX22199.1 hypothetical protein FisN_19Lh263 [Fistulifera solaris]
MRRTICCHPLLLVVLVGLCQLHGVVSFTAHKSIALRPVKPTLTTTTTTTTSSSSLQATPTVGIGAIAGAITGGLFAGGLHAIAGPDHLAALLPRCCGQRWYRAVRVGALWGMGHGLSATVLGLTAFGLKSTVQNMKGMQKVLAGASHVTEIAVGLSLIVIGVMGIREAREWEQDLTTTMGASQSLSAAVVDEVASKHSTQKRAVLFNGILHGFSWDGAPSLAPAVAVATWGGSLAFLSAYAIGTMTTMALATTLIGEGTRKAGQVLDRPDIPQKLSFVSSILAMVIGAVWCYLAVA